MHSSPISPVTSLPAVLSPVAAANDNCPGRRSARVAAVDRFEARAERELRAYFARPKDAPSTVASDAVKAVLVSIPAHHRGVLGLYYRARVWPEPVTRALGSNTPVAIRLNCADHPATGPTPLLEQAASDRVAALFAVEGHESPTLIDLRRRAFAFHERALRSYANALAKAARRS